MVEKSTPSSLWPALYDPFRNLGARVAEMLAPASDASGGESAYTITMELPGVSEDDIEVNVDAGVVTVSGEKSSEREESGDTWFFTERQYGSFTRSFRLPADAEQDKVEGHMKDGVLTITVPRRQSEPDGGKKKVAIRKG
ncbi:Hsp20/alpha crystallin family protein [Rhodosalinus sediminis]|uniref:Hsp20/alpha crystallin family protein n=1 Tax=Rhodosalinus sediminis TaxID=1940533 RepID=A0A3D9BMV6_9RHOB|nr:Hsp20/alpha crystallin family protein [Rhodosalinus sediminis]REC54844.1 Hsp20/alpha crystallin family protein [Rhodosalinus sediminis]